MQGGSQGKQQLPAAKEFVQRCSRIAPEMNAKLLLAPMLAAAVAGIDTSFSPQIITTVLNATSTRELTECNGEAAPQMAPQERPRGAEKPPLKRMLFAADDTADSGQQLVQRWQRSALDEICVRVTPSNAAKLAALIRSLPDLVALLRQALPTEPLEHDSAEVPPLGHSTVLLALLYKQMSAEPRDAAENKESASQDLAQTYKASRKYLKQLEAGHLTTFLRFLLLRGRPPLPLSAVPTAPALLPGPLRLQIVQDGITLLDAIVASAEKDNIPNARHAPQVIALHPLLYLK